MPEPTFRERLDARLAVLDAEVERVQKNAALEIARLRETKKLLVRASEHLTPEREELLLLLKREGLL